MMIEHELVMRWGDIDSYRHVNNVRYVDYADEGRDRLVQEGLIPADHQVASLSVDYLAPLHLTRRPVVVTNELDGDRLVQQVCVDRAEGREVYCRVVTQLGRSDAPGPVPDDAARWQHDLPVRLQDVGPGGTVTVARAADIAQEMRVAYIGHLDAAGSFGPYLVAAVQLGFHGPIRRHEPGQVAWSWTSRVGTSSCVLELEARSGAGVLLRASSVMVAIDAETQRSRPLSDAERSVLGGGVVSGPAPVGG